MNTYSVYIIKWNPFTFVSNSNFLTEQANKQEMTVGEWLTGFIQIYLNKPPIILNTASTE